MDPIFVTFEMNRVCFLIYRTEFAMLDTYIHTYIRTYWGAIMDPEGWGESLVVKVLLHKPEVLSLV